MVYVLPNSQNYFYWKGPSGADDGIVELQYPPTPRYEGLQELNMHLACSQADTGYSQDVDVDLAVNGVSFCHL
jgi:hypothetical protein